MCNELGQLYQSFEDGHIFLHIKITNYSWMETNIHPIGMSHTRCSQQKTTQVLQVLEILVIFIFQIQGALIASKKQSIMVMATIYASIIYHFYHIVHDIIS